MWQPYLPFSTSKRLPMSSRLRISGLISRFFRLLLSNLQLCCQLVHGDLTVRTRGLPDEEDCEEERKARVAA